MEHEALDLLLTVLVRKMGKVRVRYRSVNGRQLQRSAHYIELDTIEVVQVLE